LLFYRNILGGGSFLSFRDPAEFVPAFDTLETDLFDVFFMYGIIGVAVYCGITLMGTYTALIRRMPMLMFFFLVVMAHSLVAGHVIFNGMSVLGVVLLLLIANFQPLKIRVLND
jgi:hypothetical protein